MSHSVPQRELDPPRVEELARVVLRPVASRLPLGFLGLAVGSALLTATQLKWIAVTQAATRIVKSLPSQRR